jgi:Tfp pilus assembly protein PilN
MINLLSSQAKHEIRAARLNVLLIRYVGIVFGVIVFVFIIFGVGYVITSTERSAAMAELDEHKQEADAYKQIQLRAQDFSNNLATAKTILSGEIMYSSLLVTIAGALPKDTVLNELALDNIALKSAKPITFEAQAKNYTAALQLKSSLEASPLLEKVNISSIAEKPTLPGQPTPAYPLVVRINASVTKSALQNMEPVQ